jgi:superoxide dismutase, Cu-Zn family
MAVKNLFMIFGLILIVGCSMAAPGSHATADLKDKDGNTVGKAVLRDTADGVLVRLEVKGLTPGLHAVHVHAVGKCEGPAFTSAGGHFNPLQRKHGLKSPDGAHAGDLPNMLVTKDGSGGFESKTDAITFTPIPPRYLTAMAALWSFTSASMTTSPIQPATPVTALLVV